MLQFDAAIPWYTRIKLLRTMKGLSQADAAKLINTVYRNYQRWEYGEVIPTAPSRERIAKALGVGIGDIFPAEIVKKEEMEVRA